VNGAAMDFTAMFSVGGQTVPGGTGFIARSIAFVGRTPTTGKAVYLQNGNAAEFYGNTFTSMYLPVEMSSSYGVIFDHNTWDKPSIYCVVATTAAHHTVFSKNKFYTTGTSQCIHLTVGSDAVVVRDNDAEGGTTFFQMDGTGSSLTFEGNYVEGFSNVLFYFAGTVNGGSISNNWLSLSGTTTLQGAVGFRFDGNRSYNQTITSTGSTNLRAHGNTVVPGTGATIGDTNP
jgi:hypothetical protein